MEAGPRFGRDAAGARSGAGGASARAAALPPSPFDATAEAPASARSAVSSYGIDDISDGEEPAPRGGRGGGGGGGGARRAPARGVSWHPPDTLVSVREYEVSEAVTEEDWEDRRRGSGCCAVM